MGSLISLIVWGVIVYKVIVVVKGILEEQKETKQRQPVQRTTQAERDAYYYSQQRATKERLKQKYASNRKAPAQQKTAEKKDILSRAKDNVRENEPDLIQQQMHADVCRDFHETAQMSSDVAVHKKTSELCDNDEMSDIIKRVNDLIATGYSGDMHFERDFIAEGVDMLNRFTI